MGRLVNPVPLVFGREHGSQRGGRGSRQEMSRAMAGKASGREVFTLLVRLLMTHFDGVDTEEGCTKFHTFGMCNGTPLSDFSREVRVLVSTATGSECVRLRGRMWCWRWFRWRRMSNFRLSCLRCTLVRRHRTRGHTPRWMLCGGLLVTKRIIRNLPSTAKHFFSACFFDGSAVIRPVGAPARRSWARPGPSAVPVAFVADGIEPSSNCHAHR